MKCLTCFSVYTCVRKIFLNAICCNFTQSAKLSIHSFKKISYPFYLMDQSEKSVIISGVHC